MAKRGRPFSALPKGMTRAMRTRGGVYWFADGWPEDLGPTFGTSLRQGTGRKPGRASQLTMLEHVELTLLRQEMDRMGKRSRDGLLAAMLVLEERSGGSLALNRSRACLNALPQAAQTRRLNRVWSALARLGTRRSDARKR